MPKRFATSARPLADLIGGLVAPHCRKRGIANLALTLEPADLFGARFAKAASVERIVWPRDEDGQATLVVKADGAAALALQHVAPQVVERANTIIGWPAIGRLRISQAGRRKRRAAPPTPAAPVAPLSEPCSAALHAQTSTVTDEKLKAALNRLGTAVARRSLSERPKRP